MAYPFGPKSELAPGDGDFVKLLIGQRAAFASDFKLLKDPKPLEYARYITPVVDRLVSQTIGSGRYTMTASDKLKLKRLVVDGIISDRSIFITPNMSLDDVETIITGYIVHTYDRMMNGGRNA